MRVRVVRVCMCTYVRVRGMCMCMCICACRVCICDMCMRARMCMRLCIVRVPASLPTVRDTQLSLSPYLSPLHRRDGCWLAAAAQPCVNTYGTPRCLSVHTTDVRAGDAVYVYQRRRARYKGTRGSDGPRAGGTTVCTLQCMPYSLAGDTNTVRTPYALHSLPPRACRRYTTAYRTF